jgi:hypothetical protein
MHFLSVRYEVIFTITFWILALGRLTRNSDCSVVKFFSHCIEFGTVAMSVFVYMCLIKNVWNIHVYNAFEISRTLPQWFSSYFHKRGS